MKKTDLNQLLETNLSPLARISPSRFIELEECALRGAIAASNISRLLPGSPNARLGSIIHKMFELASKRLINDAASFNEKWNETLAQTEAAMASGGLEEHLVPLELHVKNFEVKKNLCLLGIKKLLQLRTMEPLYKDQPRTTSSTAGISGSELSFETQDKKVGGVIDAIHYGEHGVEIIDYKSGTIVEETPAGAIIKKAYQVQLKIYASLYYLKTGSWPVKLKLLGINQQVFDVPFTPEECLLLIEQVKQKLEEINGLLVPGQQWEDLASPSPAACRFCAFRPVCKKYVNSIKEGNDWPVDAAGIIVEKQKFKNGYRVVLQTTGGKLVVRGLDENRHPVLNEPVENIMLFNLRPDTSAEHFTGGIFTASFATPFSFL
jgi:CRISPR/Cas system-associated exonuclease Cas4 (RecB family)